MSTISSVGSAATQPPIKKRKVLDTNQIPALTSTYITWKDHTTKQNQLSDGNHQVQQIPQSPSIPMTLNELPDDCNMSAISSGGSGSRTAKSFEEMKRIKRQKTNLVGNHQVQQIPQSPRNRPIKKTVTKKSFAGVSVNQRDKNGLNVLAKAAELASKRQRLEGKISETNGSEGVRGQQFFILRHFVYPPTPILEAAQNGDISEVEKLLARGADVNAKGRYKRTALHWAVTTEIVQLLLARGADVNATDQYGRTPLYLAAFKGHKDIVQALVIAGADLNATDNDGETALDLVKHRDYSNIENAIEAGKKELIAQLGALEKEHIEKSVELIDSLRKSLFKTSNTNNQDFLNKLLGNNAGKRTLGLCFLEPKLRLKKSRQYSAEAATKI